MIDFDYSLSFLFEWSIKDVYASFQTIIEKLFTTNRTHGHFLISRSNIIIFQQQQRRVFYMWPSRRN